MPAVMFNPDSSYQSLVDQLYGVPSESVSRKLQQLIPLLTIVGHQSQGKSKTLESLTRLPFVHGSGMVTRFAIRTNLRRDVTLVEDFLTAKIEGEDGFNRRYKNGISRDSFRTVIEDASNVLCGTNRSISDKVLEITLTGPNQSPLTIIDLPGIIGQQRDSQSADLPKIIENITRRYIKDPRTIILAVMGADNDFESSRILSLASEYDPEGERTVPIVTKTDEIKDTQGWMSVILNKDKVMRHGWLVVCNKSYEEDSSWEYARQKEEEFFQRGIWRKVHASRKGRGPVLDFLGKLLHDLILKALPAIKAEVSTELYRLNDDLDAMGTPIATIQSACEQVTQANNELQRQVARFLNADYSPEYLVAYAGKSLANMSRRSGVDSDTDDDDYTDDGQESVAVDDDDDDDDDVANDNGSSELTVRTELMAGVDPRFVRSSLQRMYKQYRSAMMDGLHRVTYAEMERQIALYKSCELEGFISFTTFKGVYNGHYLPGWIAITKEHVDRMHNFFRDALQGYIRYACTNKSTAKVFTASFSRFARDQKNEIDRTVKDIFGDEQTPFALNRQFVESVYRERAKNHSLPAMPVELSVTERNEHRQPTQQKLQQLSHLRTPPPEPSQPTATSTTPENNASSSQNQSSSRVDSDWNDVLSTKAMVPCMLAYLTTALDRIVDVVLMQTIERHMIRRIYLYFDLMSQPTEDILKSLIEPPHLQERRKDLKSKIADLERLMDEL
ncbi:hypothetical protein DFQ26_006009 [Actinomortierella ambigua]|nr:hypothetical protein DFQ26_006009 [Actinomortierella ambigua]